LWYEDLYFKSPLGYLMKVIYKWIFEEPWPSGISPHVLTQLKIKFNHTFFPTWELGILIKNKNGNTHNYVRYSLCERQQSEVEKQRIWRLTYLNLNRNYSTTRHVALRRMLTSHGISHVKWRLQYLHHKDLWRESNEELL
jgi:hypothetical protein